MVDVKAGMVEQAPLRQRHLTRQEMWLAALGGVGFGVTAGVFGEVGKIGAQALLPIAGEFLKEAKKFTDIFPTLHEATTFIDSFDQYSKDIATLWAQQGRVIVGGVGAATGISVTLAALDTRLRFSWERDQRSQKGVTVSPDSSGKVKKRTQLELRAAIDVGRQTAPDILKKAAEKSPETALAFRVIQRLPQRIQELEWSGSGVETTGANVGSLVSRYASPDSIYRLGALVKNLREKSGDETLAAVPDDEMEELLTRIALVDIHRDGRLLDSPLIFRGREPHAGERSWGWIKSVVTVTDERRPLANLMSASGDVARRDDLAAAKSFREFLTIGEHVDHTAVSPNVGVYGPDGRQHSLLYALKQAIELQRRGR